MGTKRNRRKFSTAFKTKVVIESLKERETLSELAKKYEVHSNQIQKWKKDFLDNAETVFDKKTSTKKEHKEVDTDKLYQKIGKLEMERDFLKKNLSKLNL